MPELLRSAKLAVEKGLTPGHDDSCVKQLSDYIIPALVEALHKVFLTSKSLHRFAVSLCFSVIMFSSFCATSLQEPETEICVSMLDALNQCMQVSLSD